MKKFLLFFAIISIPHLAQSQTNPAITNWLINSNGNTGRHYVKNNSTPIIDNVQANVQTVQYSTNWVYISTHGIPAYITGPYLDGNPSIATDQNAIFKIPLSPVKNTGTLTATTGGDIGNFINGVALFDYRDGVSWQNSTSSLKGGPLGGQGDQVWNRDAIVGERTGFDCSKAHPAMGNYHHHQNPSTFKLDLKVISNVCDLYASDGLYALDSTKHSPLLGFAYDGFPIYGAYSYKNADGTGGITRMKSSWSLRNITSRTTYYTGNTVTAGPAVNSTYPLGYFREDYQYLAPSQPDFLDDHNGRFCITPEYPEGIYCYFTTVDENWNSTYPYVVGPTFYGVKTAAKVTSITEAVTTYTGKAYNLSVSKNIISINSSANSTATFDISSNTDWTVSNVSWLTIDKKSGNGNATITLTAKEDSSTTSRTATITVAGTGVSSQLITVTQLGASPFLTVSTNSLSINNTNQSTNSFVINSNTNWRISSDQTWITLSKDSGNGNSNIILTANENTLITTRTANITVSGNGVANQILIVKQDSVGRYLNIFKPNIILSDNANASDTFNIKSNTQWKIQSNQKWLKIDKDSGSNNALITITAEENFTGTRTATISIIGSSVSPIYISVTQVGKGPFLNKSTSFIVLAAANNSQDTFDIISNTDWKITSNQNWFSIDKMSGNISAKITLTALENTDTNSREATLSITGSKISLQNILVTQLGTKPTAVPNLDNHSFDVKLYPNPASDLIILQVNNINYDNINIELFDNSGKLMQSKTIYQGSTLSYFDTQTLYSGEYLIKISNGRETMIKRLILNK